MRCSHTAPLLLGTSLLIATVYLVSDRSVTAQELRASSQGRFDIMLVRFFRNLMNNNHALNVASRNFMQKYGINNEGQSRFDWKVVGDVAGMFGSFFKLINTILEHALSPGTGGTTTTTTTKRPWTTVSPSYRNVDLICESLCNCDERGNDSIEPCPPLRRRPGNDYHCAGPPTCHINCEVKLISPLDPNYGSQELPARSLPSLGNKTEKSSVKVETDTGKMDPKKFIGLQLYEQHMQKHFNATMRRDLEEVLNHVKPYTGAYEDVSILLNFFNDREPTHTKGKHRSAAQSGARMTNFGMAFRAILGHLLHSLDYCPPCMPKCKPPISHSCPNYKDCGHFMCHCSDTLFGLSDYALRSK